ncbi:MAG: thymidine phosphorylase, partial [Faecalibacillus sp.]
KLYALRDVTATVSCIPLIASSIMSKKLASGADTILLDVKYGKGAFMQTKEDAVKLAQLMIDIGKHCHRDTRATISNMNQPLGKAIGNSLEVIEAIETLKGNGPDDLEELCLQAGSQMLVQSHLYEDEKDAYQALKEVIKNGKGLEKFKQMVKAQDGDVSYIENPERFEKARVIIELPSQKTGYVKSLEARSLGIVAMKLGGGRMTKDEEIDHRVGLLLHKKVGDYVIAGESLLQIHANQDVSDELLEELYQSYEIVEEFVEKPVLIEEMMK